MSWNQEEMNLIYMKVQKLALTDEEYRELLVKDTNTAIEKVAGKGIPAGFKVKVIENDPDYQATFVLPDFVGDEIGDADLEGVAGGVSNGLTDNFCSVYGGKDTYKGPDIFKVNDAFKGICAAYC